MKQLLLLFLLSNNLYKILSYYENLFVFPVSNNSVQIPERITRNFSGFYCQNCVKVWLNTFLFTAPFKPPANLTGKATSSTSIFVEWGSVVLPNLRGILRGYMVYYQEAPGSVHPSVLRNVTVAISVSETQLDNLQKYTKYHIWVTAFTTREGWLSNSIFVRTHEDSE